MGKSLPYGTEGNTSPLIEIWKRARNRQVDALALAFRLSPPDPDATDSCRQHKTCGNQNKQTSRV